MKRYITTGKGKGQGWMYFAEWLIPDKTAADGQNHANKGGGHGTVVIGCQRDAQQADTYAYDAKFDSLHKYHLLTRKIDCIV